MNGLVLSLFPGIGLLDRAFEEEGFCIVRGPDVLWGGDNRRFTPPPRIFRGVIGGPPCQKHSTASAIVGTEAIDLIPDFVRIVDESQAEFAVMENVSGAWGHEAIPRNWNPVELVDFDCGGETKRRRCFFTWPMMVLSPGRRGRGGAHTVMASTFKRGRSDSQYVIDKCFLPGDLPVEEYGRLQGCESLAVALRDHPFKFSRSSIIGMLGNGVPLAMGRTIARAVKEALRQESDR